MNTGRMTTETLSKFDVQLENLVDGRGAPCQFRVEINVVSLSHGDDVALTLMKRIRANAFEAVEEFDESLSEREHNEEEP